MKKIFLLFVVLFVFLGCDSQVVVEENIVVESEYLSVPDVVENEILEVEDVEEEEDLSFLNKFLSVGGDEWIGRVVDLKYELVKVDVDGFETLMYEGALDSLFPDTVLEDRDGVVFFEHHKGYPEGGERITVVFGDEGEIFRVVGSYFWGFIQQFSVKYPGEDEFFVEMEVSDDCSNFLENGNTWDLTEDMKAEFYGVNLGDRFFEFENPEKVDCTIIDGSVMTPTLRIGDIQIDESGIFVEVSETVNFLITKDSISGEAMVRFIQQPSIPHKP